MDQSIPPRRLTQRQQAKAATRAKVVAAATALFNAKGYDLVTMRDIADKANVSTGGIFASFTGKQAVWEACAGYRMPKPAEYAELVAAADQASQQIGIYEYPATGPRLRAALIHVKR